MGAQASLAASTIFAAQIREKYGMTDKQIQKISDIIAPCILPVIFIVILFFGLKHFAGTKVPGSFFESGKDYSAKVYVNLFPVGNSVKNYHVPADIEKSADSDGYTVYSVFKVYWPYGGTTDFDDCNFYKINDREYCQSTDIDSNGDSVSYYAILTNEKVK